MSTPAALFARRLGLREAQVDRVLALFEDGASIPFVARYRKEATGGLDEVQLAAISDQRTAWQALEARRTSIRGTLEEREVLTPALAAAIDAATELTQLEDLYAPFKQRRTTRAGAAREKGLEPLAEAIRTGRSRRTASLEDLAREALAAGAEVADEAEALAGAADILAEQLATEPALREAVRELAWRHATFDVAYRKDAAAKDEKGTYRSLDGYVRPASRVPADRVLAALRGEREKLLRIRLELDADGLLGRGHRALSREALPAADDWLGDVVSDAWRRLLWPAIQVDLRRRLREEAEEASTEIFATNLESLLLAPPKGAVAVLGIDPGYRTGCKVAALDATGRFLAHATIYPTPPRRDTDGARKTLRGLLERHRISVVGVGSGTGGRETLAFVRELADAAGLDLEVYLVDESGASIYSAGESARREFPDLDLTIRGAISIGRRLQDPLAELVKIEPRSIGVGQYQHDVDPDRLDRALGHVVERVVNGVGVDLNTASAELLTHVSGLGPGLARRVVAHREDRGPYPSRKALLEVAGLGPKTFEQAAGFCRITGGAEPLDASGIHPEAYPLAERIAAAVGHAPAELPGHPERLQGVDPTAFVDERFGLPTVEDILAELARPGRDPRGEATGFAFAEGVTSIDDLQRGMTLPGRVTNVAAFGAFVDIGIKKDGLIHVSKLRGRPLRVGQTLEVRVEQVDAERQRIGLEPA